MATTNSLQTISNAFIQYKDELLVVLRSRLHDADLAEDMLQDVFLRLMTYQDILREETVKSFIFTIANNMVLDHYRHQAIIRRVHGDIKETASVAFDGTFQKVVCDNIASMEEKVVGNLSNMQQKVYRMARFDEKTSQEIALELGLSSRTVESHLYSSRKEVRNYMARMVM